MTAVFSKLNKLLYRHSIVSTVDKGIENKSYFIALSDKGFQNKERYGVTGEELKKTQMKKRKTDSLPSRNSFR